MVDGVWVMGDGGRRRGGRRGRGDRRAKTGKDDNRKQPVPNNQPQREASHKQSLFLLFVWVSRMGAASMTVGSDHERVGVFVVGEPEMADSSSNHTTTIINNYVLQHERGRQSRTLFPTSLCPNQAA
jgi:hypothetical protein